MSFFARPSQAQDLHYSQYQLSPHTLTPALAGIFNGDHRFSGIFRNQWSSVPVDYTTITAGYDRRFMLGDSKNFINFGVNLNIDQAGDLQYQLAQGGLSLGYTLALNDNNLITPAVQLNFSQRSIDATQARGFSSTGFLEQYLNSGNVTQLSLGLGLNWRIQQTERTNIDLGAAVAHLNTPALSFIDSTENTNRKLSLYGIGGFELTEKADLKIRGLGQFQGATQFLLGGGVKLYLNQQRGKQLALEIAGNYRLGDALYPNFIVYYNNLTVGLSYDINISDFTVATNNRGGPEIAIQYIIKSVKPLKDFKACPIY